MRLLVLARLESPAPASVEGYLAPYSSGVQQHSGFSVSASWSIRVGRGLDEAHSTIRAEFGTMWPQPTLAVMSVYAVDAMAGETTVRRPDDVRTRPLASSSATAR